MLGLTPEQLGGVLVALSIAITTVLGTKAGKNATSKKPQQPNGDMIEVAGALVSDKSAAEIIRAFDTVSSALNVLARCIELNTEACRDAAKQAQEATDAMEVLTREIIRKH